MSAAANVPASTRAALFGLPPGSRIAVAMSGGVDSSVVAALLKRLDYDVVGITLQLYDHGRSNGRRGACCAGQDIHDARRVADAIGIPHYVFDYEARFREAVIEPFAESYLSGETPIPCVACNQSIKFLDLLGTVRELGAAALATGHYAEIRQTPGGPELYRAADTERDQSYFLFATSREQLADLRFPLGGIEKSAVRGLAADLGLVVAEKPDSQDICFVPTGRYADVIERLRPDACEAGDIMHIDGRVLGRHRGIIHFTIGQRRGLGIASAEPFYVVRVEAHTRTVVVGPRQSLHQRRVALRNVNWLGHVPIEALMAAPGTSIYARLRSSQPPKAARLLAEDDGISVLLEEGEFGISPGQACVIYADGSPRARVLGGGWITSATERRVRLSMSPIDRDNRLAELSEPVVSG